MQNRGGRKPFGYVPLSSANLDEEEKLREEPINLRYSQSKSTLSTNQNVYNINSRKIFFLRWPFFFVGQPQDQLSPEANAFYQTVVAFCLDQTSWG
jgi:hypothetical protein